MNDFIIQKLTELYIKQYEQDKETNSPVYVKKTEIYKDLIQWFKEYGKNDVLVGQI